MNLARRLQVLARASQYELRKVTVFRMGFLVREVLNGVIQPVSMTAVYWALYRGDTTLELRGWTLPDLLAYLIGIAIFAKLVFHGRVLDVSEQIFQGYFTKYLVMPLPFALLPLARWVQYTVVQLAVVSVLWGIGAAIGPSWWPYPVDARAVLEALALALVGSLCFFELYLIVNLLAFWLDVVWSLIVMSQFVTDFFGGRFVPVSQMPEPLARAFEALFPYWAIAAPVERFLGRLDSSDTARGLVVLSVSFLVLEGLRRVVWLRGTRQYTGAGM